MFRPDYPACEWCKGVYRRVNPAQRFCSSKCRVQSHRYDLVRDKANYSPEASPNEKAVATKQSQARLKTCPECDMYFEVDGLHHAQKYCSNACKQKSYRRARSWRYETPRETQERVAAMKTPEDRANEALRAMFESIAAVQDLAED